MLALLLTAQLLTPSEAAAVLARLKSTSNMTGRFACTDCGGPRVGIVGTTTGGPFGPFPNYPVQRPLNCCSVYVIRVPHQHRRY